MCDLLWCIWMKILRFVDSSSCWATSDLRTRVQLLIKIRRERADLSKIEKPVTAWSPLNENLPRVFETTSERFTARHRNVSRPEVLSFRIYYRTSPSSFVRLLISCRPAFVRRAVDTKEWKTVLQKEKSERDRDKGDWWATVAIGSNFVGNIFASS